MDIGDLIHEHQTVVNSLSHIAEDILESGEAIRSCLANKGKLILMGNGGSAADSQHIAAELVVRYKKNRIALPAIALTTDTSILTATANDFSYEEIFSRQIEALADQRDIIVGISTSGNSRNILLGLDAAKRKKATTIGLTGSSGGEVCKMVDYSVVVESTSTARIQECHIFIGHIWCEYLDEAWG